MITTASAANHDYLRTIGVDEIIDYNAVDFTKAVKNCDAVFDTVGGDVALKSFAVLKPDGSSQNKPTVLTRLAQVCSPLPGDTPDVFAATANEAIKAGRFELERIVELVTVGAVRPPEVTLYQLNDAVAAHRVSESRHFRGKLVFKVR